MDGEETKKTPPKTPLNALIVFDDEKQTITTIVLMITIMALLVCAVVCAIAPTL